MRKGEKAWGHFACNDRASCNSEALFFIAKQDYTDYNKLHRIVFRGPQLLRGFECGQIAFTKLIGEKSRRDGIIVEDGIIIEKQDAKSRGNPEGVE